MDCLLIISPHFSYCFKKDLELVDDIYCIARDILELSCESVSDRQRKYDILRILVPEGTKAEAMVFKCAKDCEDHTMSAKLSELKDSLLPSEDPDEEGVSCHL